jgi:uracil-DNA glycosylase
MENSLDTKIKDGLIKLTKLNPKWYEYSAFDLVEETLLNVVKDKKKTGKDNEPALTKIFAAFGMDPADLKVIVLGMDPYPSGEATGMAFDNRIAPHPIKPSPSLANIIKLIRKVPEEDQFKSDINSPPSTYLEHLPKQGVLLLNTALSVRRGVPNSHKSIWTPFTTALIKDINEKHDGIIWILWGNNAKAYKNMITNSTHIAIEGVHPSPLAGAGKKSHPFLDKNYFILTNEELVKQNKEKIKW